MATPLAQLRYSRVYDPADFREPRFRERLVELFGEPREGRAEWEAAAAAEAIEALGAAGSEADVLVAGPVGPELRAWLSARAASVTPAASAEHGIRAESADLVCAAGPFDGAGGMREAARAARGIFEALRPGGAASLTTAVRLRGEATPRPPFAPAQLREILLADGMTWALSAPFDHALPADGGPGGAAEDVGVASVSAHLLLVKPLFH